MNASVGMIFYGYCNGYFEKYCYGPRIVEAVGKDWAVVRKLSDESLHFLQGSIVNNIPLTWLEEESYE